MWKLSDVTNNTGKEIMINYDVASNSSFSSVIPELGSVSILMPEIGILYCSEVADVPANPNTSERLLGVFISLNGRNWMFKYADNIQQYGPGTFSLTLEANGTFKLASTFNGFHELERIEGAIEKEITQLKLDYGMPNLVVVATPKDIERQMNLPNKVSFIDALSKAINSFLYDGKDIESPFSYIKNDPESSGLPRDADNDALSERLRTYMNLASTSIILITDEYQYKPEHGETVADNWSFRLNATTFSADMHWAIVDRQGVKATYNYGFS